MRPNGKRRADDGDGRREHVAKRPRMLEDIESWLFEDEDIQAMEPSGQQGVPHDEGSTTDSGTFLEPRKKRAGKHVDVSVMFDSDEDNRGKWKDVGMYSGEHAGTFSEVLGLQQEVKDDGWLRRFLLEFDEGKDHDIKIGDAPYVDNVEEIPEDIRKQARLEAESALQVPITPFNLKEEQEMGHFDKDGHFVFKKPHQLDPFRHHDAWLDGIDTIQVWKARVAQEQARKDRAKEEADKRIKDELELGTGRPDDWKRMLAEMLSTDSETVLQAVRRIGFTEIRRKHKRTDKSHGKRRNAASSRKSSRSRSVNREGLARLSRITTLAHKLLENGCLDIYNQTRHDLLMSLSAPSQSRPVEVVTPSLFSSNDAQDMSEKMMWEYKWSNAPSDPVWGPCSEEEMRSWIRLGFFGPRRQRPVVVRRVVRTGEVDSFVPIDESCLVTGEGNDGVVSQDTAVK